MGVEVGERLPIFDVTVSAAKKSTTHEMTRMNLHFSFTTKDSLLREMPMHR